MLVTLYCNDWPIVTLEYTQSNFRFFLGWSKRMNKAGHYGRWQSVIYEDPEDTAYE